MVRISDVVPNERTNLENLDCPVFDQPVVLPGRPLSKSRVALISSAGLMQRADTNVPGNSADYRTINKATPDRDILINHISINFDRSGFAEDPNCVFPRERLKELAANGIIDSAAPDHYSFMGATHPDAMQENVERLVGELKAKSVNAVCLLPV